MLRKNLIHNSTQNNQLGFTLIELIITIITLGILATIVILFLNDFDRKAFENQHSAEASTLELAIIRARINTEASLHKITGLSPKDTTASKCLKSKIEPKDRPKTDVCWSTYYSSLDKISKAAEVNLNAYKKGDKRGNPYAIFENEERKGCERDYIGWFSGKGAETNRGIALKPYTLPCQ